jgi:hypothetical protein
MAAISNDILSSTLRILLDEAVDNLYRSTPLLDQIRADGGLELYDGGSQLDVPLILEEHSSITQMSSGYEPINLAVQDALRQAQFGWCDFIAPIVITQREELSNKGDRAVLSIAEARMKSVMGTLRREWEKQAVAGTSTVLTDMLTLNGGASSTGFLEGLATGTQNNTVGGLAKATFRELENQFVDAATTLSIPEMSNLMINCQIKTPDGSAPNLILASPLFYQTYKGLLFNNERYVDESVLDGGRLALAFNTAKMYVDSFLPAVSDSSNALSAYFLNTKFLKVGFDSEANFKMSDFETVSGYAARSANIYVRTQLYFHHLASQGVLVRGES